jgi:hypothetical protein
MNACRMQLFLIFVNKGDVIMSNMRFQDYLNRLDDNDRNDVLRNLDREEDKLRKFLSRFDENELNGIAIMMNDTFEMEAPELPSVIDFIVELYKCQKADFLYENVGECIEDIKMFAEEEFN